MSNPPIFLTLVEALHAARYRDLPDGWLYLQDQSFHLNTACALLPASGNDPDLELHVQASALGFPVPGLDTSDVMDVVQAADDIANIARDDILLEAFSYYRRWNTLLPRPGAPPPPPPNILRQQQKQELISRLGPERPNRPCRSPGCPRGSVSLSVYCPEHHYQQLFER